MLAASYRPSNTKPSLWQLVKAGTKHGLVAGSKIGALRSLATFYEEILPLHGLKNWAYWLLQSEYTLIEFAHSLHFGKYVTNSIGEGIFALFRTVLENICIELITGFFPGLEKDTMYQLEYLWRGVQGRNLPPKPPAEVDLAGTSYAYSAYQEWAPVCHPVVEYSKPKSEWTPRMFAASEMSKALIPNVSVMMVGMALDLTSFFLGKSTAELLVTRLWKEFYMCTGGLLGVGVFAAAWSVSSASLLPLFPTKLQPFVPALVPQLGLAIGGAVLANVIFPFFWSFESGDEPLPAFMPRARLEKQRREMVYGPRNSKYARPLSFAPISPQFIHPELNRLYLQAVFPELLPPSTPSESGAKPSREEPDLDNVTKLRLELQRARRRTSPTSQATPPPSRPITPIASQANSSEESDSSASDSETDSDSESEASDSDSSSSSSSTEESSSSLDETQESEESSQESESEEESEEESSEEEDSD